MAEGTPNSLTGTGILEGAMDSWVWTSKKWKVLLKLVEFYKIPISMVYRLFHNHKRFLITDKKKYSRSPLSMGLKDTAGVVER